jgi:hypothetical protein
MSFWGYIGTVVPFLVIGVLFLFAEGTWYYAGATLIAIGFALWIGTGFAIWRVYQRKIGATHEQLRRMSRPQFRFEFSEDGVASKNELGSAQLSWKAFRELYRTPDVWLLFITKTRYAILPVAALSREAQEFIVRKCREHNMRVT